MNVLTGVSKALTIQDRIAKTTRALDALTNGALAAATGIGLVVGAVGGGIAWIIGAGPGAILLYRLAAAIVRRILAKSDRVIETVRAVWELEVKIAQSQLPEDRRRDLLASLHSVLPQPTERSRALPPGPPPP